MMPMRTTWIFVALLCAGSAAARAEGGCPSGTVLQSGQGWQTCVPVPGGDDGGQQSGGVPQAFQGADHWIDRWGAIATHGPSASLGTVNGMPTQRDAEQAALGKCHAQHGATCKLSSFYRNGCGVMVVDASGKYYNTDGGATIQEASEKAMSTCKSDGHADCHVYYSGCSLPVRIQ
jgi:hypothetical protein